MIWTIDIGGVALQYSKRSQVSLTRDLLDWESHVRINTAVT
jgi:hypothetical protein